MGCIWKFKKVTALQMMPWELECVKSPRQIIFNMEVMAVDTCAGSMIDMDKECKIRNLRKRYV